MADIMLTIPTEYVPRVLEAFAGMYTIPYMRNPDFDDKDDTKWGNPSYDPPEYILEYTDGEWTRKKVLDYIKKIVENYEKRAASKLGADSVVIPEDLVG